MSFDSFLDLYDSSNTRLEAESEDANHKGMIQVKAFKFGVVHEVKMDLGTGAASGKAQMQDIEFTINQSKASPTLFTWSCTGEHLKKAIFYCRKATGKDPADYMIIHMEGCFVTSHSTSAGEGADGMVEEMKLAYTSIQYEYHQQDDDGKVSKTAFKGGWNQKASAKFHV